jgi:hypothetical protein
VQLVHRLRHREQARHGAKGLAAEVQVGARHDDARSAVGQELDDVDDAVVQELHLVHGEDARLGVRLLQHLAAVAHGHRVHAGAVVRADARDAVVAVVQGALEELHAAPGDQGAADAADQLLGSCR